MTFDLVPEASEELDEPIVMGDAASEDVDIYEWLGRQNADATAFVEIDGARIKIAALSEAEENRILKASRRIDPKNPQQTRVDLLLYRRAMVAFSLGKAAGKPVQPEQLEKMLPGRLTKLQTEIQKLSGHEVGKVTAPDPFESLG
jgi:hypothetical protein